MNDIIPSFMPKLDGMVAENGGYFVGGKVSFIHSVLQDDDSNLRQWWPNVYIDMC